MIRSFTDYPLNKQNTFGIHVTAKYYFEFTEAEDLTGFLAVNKNWHNRKILILGEGSNLLFVSNFPGLVIHPNIPGIRITHEDRNQVWLEAGSGVIWDDLVEYAVSQGLGGIENLSLIPGKVGAAAVQNIGAYGMEIRDRIVSVTGIDLLTQTEYAIDAADCLFTYRDSIFKNQLKDRFVITAVTIRLDKFPAYILHYADLESELGKMGEINLRNVRQTIIRIRESKLPDPKVIGNAGSFFKNPVIESSKAEELLNHYPNLPHYPSTDGKTKLAAGWMIDQCGWKGYRRGDAGVHAKQALVLVNYGDASGQEIYELSEEIRLSVRDKFGVDLEREVNVIGWK